MTTTAAPSFAWGGIDPAEWIRSWQMAWRGAPDTSVQPILPGWTLNLNSNNSSSPQTEVDVVAKHSYGRQIGRMADVLEALVVEQLKKDLEFLKALVAALLVSTDHAHAQGPASKAVAERPTTSSAKVRDAISKAQAPPASSLESGHPIDPSPVLTVADQASA